MSASRKLKWILVCLGIMMLVPVGWTLVRVWPRKLGVRIEPAVPIPFVKGRKLGLALRTQVLMAGLGLYSKKLPAYLYLNFLRSQEGINSLSVFACPGPATRGHDDGIFLQVDKNILQSVPYLGSLIAEGDIRDYSLHGWTSADLSLCRKQTKRLDEEFLSPPRLRLHQIPDRLLIGPMADFLVFKSDTDIRVRKRRDPTLAPLTVPEARRLANDILIVSRFYSLPLAYLLGIGAMENNYMSVRGDLGYAIWKRHRQPGDVVLARRHGRVLVRNDSLGVWQITRETLRYAQILYLRDRRVRDYNRLPERLRPQIESNPDDIRPESLTTYAGLLFRNLLDRFHGNVMLAVGAYNGGASSPNLAYARLVRRVALYARRVIYHAVFTVGSHHPSQQ